MALLSTKLPWELAQTKWPSILNPIISLPMLNGNQVNSISLKANTPRAINHLLQRIPQGWLLVDKSGNVNVWRVDLLTTTTITLESSGDTTISLFIY